MLCPKCGALVEGNSRFCAVCGAEVTKSRNVENSSQGNSTNNVSVGTKKEWASEKEKSATTNEKKFNFGLLVGTFLIFVGFSRIFGAGTSISATSFGADFYTYTYQGIVAVSEILASIEVTLGWGIVSIGVVIDVLSARH